MKYAILDTETSTLFDFTKPADAKGQARLASFAVVILDEALTVLDEFQYLIRPDGWEMQPGATAVNGFTTEFLAANGIPVRPCLEFYSQIVKDGCVVVSFNAMFDTKVMRGELRRAGLPDLFESTPNICVMRALTEVCKIPRAKGAGYKFPKLSEACAFFKIDEPAAHSALGDARSAAALLRELHKLQLMPAPTVHLAKNHPTTTPTTL